MCIYGFGFSVYASESSLVQFIFKHRDTVSGLTDGMSLLNEIATTPVNEINLHEYCIDYESEVSGNKGVYGIIADVMYKETGISFEYRCADETEDDIIFLPAMMPWQMNEREKSITEDELLGICNSYIEDLGEPLLSEYVKYEYCE